MSNKEELRRLVISAIHGMPYEKAIKLEEKNDNCIVIFSCKEWSNDVCKCSNSEYKDFCMDCGLPKEAKYIYWGGTSTKIENEYRTKGEVIGILGLPITIGRVLHAITIKQGGMGLLSIETDSRRMFFRFNENCYWELTKPDGQEAELSDQSEETIEKLLQIFKAE